MKLSLNIALVASFVVTILSSFCVDTYVADTSEQSDGNTQCDTTFSDADKVADFANYFISYGYISHQKQMLTDTVRMRAYNSAILKNKDVFEGKVVLDVGAGSGVLSIWAAQANAKKVYAIEYTDMAKIARKNVDKNGFADVIEVIQTSVEELELPEKVDIIVSEWMGYFLLRESMLDSVIKARDKWLKPDGLMFPSHAAMQIAPVSNEKDRIENGAQFDAKLEEWETFAWEMQGLYNFDVTAITQDFHDEQEQYYLNSSAWIELKASNVLGSPIEIKQLDLSTCTLQDAFGVSDTKFETTLPYDSIVSGFAGWFSVDFAGTEARPLAHNVHLSTAPEVGYTHWGQQIFYFTEGLEAPAGTKIHGSASLTRQARNKRMYNFNLNLKVNEDPAMSRELHFEIP